MYACVHVCFCQHKMRTYCIENWKGAKTWDTFKKFFLSVGFETTMLVMLLWVSWLFYLVTCRSIILNSYYNIINKNEFFKNFIVLKWESILFSWGIADIQAFMVAQTVKNLPAVQETWVWFLRQEDPLEKEMSTYSSTFAGEFHVTFVSGIQHNDLVYVYIVK